MTLTTFGKKMNRRRRHHREYIEDFPYWQPGDITPEELEKRTAEIRKIKIRDRKHIEKHPDRYYWMYSELSITSLADQIDFRQGCQFLGSGKWRTSNKSKNS